MQTDLFNSSLKDDDDSGKSKSFLDRIRISLRFDQITLLAILFIILNSVIFSIGVESGKRNAVAELENKLDQSKALVTKLRAELGIARRELLERPKVIEQEEDLVDQTEVVQEVKEVMKNATAPNKKESAALQGNYTIQLVTYMNQDDVDKQLKRLKTKGLNGFVIPSGKYYQVCVNAFQNRGDANKLLTDLKSQGLAPKDAYIRAMPGNLP